MMMDMSTIIQYVLLSVLILSSRCVLTQQRIEINNKISSYHISIHKFVATIISLSALSLLILWMAPMFGGGEYVLAHTISQSVFYLGVILLIRHIRNESKLDRSEDFYD